MTPTISAKKILVLGSNGMIGAALCTTLTKKGAEVWGSSRDPQQASDRVYYIDVLQPETVRAVPWSQFDVVVDCIGAINYENTVQSAINNIRTNTLGPLQIISALAPSQTYYHCSTHAVLLPEQLQNSYSLSKLFLEQYCQKLVTPTSPKIVTLRLPAVFSEHRRSGLLFKIKQHFQTREPLELSWQSACWQAMYLPRLTEIMGTLIEKDCQESLVTIGYPVEMAIEYIIENAQRSFGYVLPISFTGHQTDRYQPTTKHQDTFISITEKALASDLQTYFQKP